MRQLTSFLLLGTLGLLNGCTQSSSSVSQTLALAFEGPQGVTITPQKIAQIPYASMLAQQNDSPEALLILAWSENINHTSSTNIPPVLKWLSANKEMIVTQAGRIIKTINLGGGNITKLSSNTIDPLILGLQKESTPKYWQYELSWQPGYHSRYAAESHFAVQGHTKVVLPINGMVDTLLVYETVNVPNLKRTYTNTYWLEPNSGRVLKSVQTLAPSLSTITLTEGKYFGAQP